jgi:predicted nuclease with TOPRIM domain
MADTLTARFEELQKRQRALEAERAQMQARKELAESRIKEFQEQARSQFGVNSLEELRALKTQWEENNLRSLQQFEKELADLEAALLALKVGDQPEG